MLIPKNYDQYDAELDHVIAWIESHNIKVPPTRVGRYRKSLADLRAIIATASASTAEHRIPEFMNTLYEVQDLIEIHKGFDGHDLKGYVRPRLQHLISGPESYQNESSNNGDARNYALELSVASRLRRGGILITPDNESDVACKIDSLRVDIECKRPQSVESIGRNIKRASKQLKSRLAQCVSLMRRGIACLDISKAVNPDFAPLYYDDVSDIKNLMESVIQRFEAKHAANLLNLCDHKIISIMIRFRAVALPRRNDGKLIQCEQYGFLLPPRNLERDDEVVRKIAERMQLN